MPNTRIAHPPSTNFYEEDESSRPLKKLRREERTDTSEENSIPPSPTLHATRRDIAGECLELPQSSQTNLESALPSIQTDQEAIDAYDAYRAAAAQDQEERNDPKSRLNARKWVKGKNSIYVDAFNLALDTVLEEETHLFDVAELALFEAWKDLTYEAQYLYVRLFLRKTSAWHRIGALGYRGDISDIDTAITSLKQIRTLPESTVETITNPGESGLPSLHALGTTSTFADISDDHINTLEEASSLLRLDELKLLAKDAKVQGKNKRDLLKAFRRMSQKQYGIGWNSIRRSDSNGSIDSETSRANSEDADSDAASTTEEPANRDALFVGRILKETGPCIRLTLAPLKLFERVHLIFYRSTEWTEKSLTTIILARIARRNFPEYIVSRSANIFTSRALLVEFEASLRTQFKVDNILEFSGKPTTEALQNILDWCDEIYPRWNTLLIEEQRKEDSIYQSGEGAYLRRLSPAWVYTRILHKGAFVHGKLWHHKREYELLVDLLNQRLFHTSRRGDWYQRKALLEEHYMADLAELEGTASEAQKKEWKRKALKTCEEGLEDPLVHVIHYYDLQKRIMKLEKSLKIAKRAQHDFAHVRLASATEVTFKGVQLIRSKVPPTNGAGATEKRRNSSPHPNSTISNRRGAKTIWIDPIEGGECSVEEMCLSHYRRQGWKGFHSEGRLVRTLFAYLLYDVLFTYIPNVFQTEYQTCPLDLHTDAFYPSRLSEINARLMQIENGDAYKIIQRVWDQHHEMETCVVGLDWTFDLHDLLEITQAFDNDALATICRVMAQEYGQRGGGIPDLFLWKINQDGSGETKFAEVKSENDKLSDTQRLWIHVLTGAGIRVELCHALAEEMRQID